MNNLLTCPPEHHSTYRILQSANVNLNGSDIIHAGSHDLIEKDLYQRMGINTVYAFECNPYVYTDLLERIKGTNWKTFNACLWSESGIKKDFYFYRNKKDGAGGLYKSDLMNLFVDCKETGETLQLTTTTLDDYIKDELVNINNVKFLNIDLQGAELEFLKGSKLILSFPALEYILCEMSTFNCYEQGAIDLDISRFLGEYYFFPIKWYKDWGNDECQHGDMLFQRIRG